MLKLLELTSKLCLRYLILVDILITQRVTPRRAHTYHKDTLHQYSLPSYRTFRDMVRSPVLCE